MRNFIIFVLTTFLLVVSVTSCKAKGGSCSASSMGPPDLYQNGVMNPNYMWDRVGNKIQVPVVLDPGYNHKERDVILGGLNEIQQKTCIEFYIFNHTGALDGYDFVYITKAKRGCWSHIGRVGGGQQELSLGKGCVNHRTAVHEMIHALGFAHEHVRSDRDNYVYIFWTNISPGRESNFAKRNTKSTDPYGPYDYASIMHYDRRAFSQNGMDTIKPIKLGAKIGVYHTMSKWDVKKLLRMYNCGHSHGRDRGHALGHHRAYESISNYIDNNLGQLSDHEERRGDYAQEELTHVAAESPPALKFYNNPYFYDYRHQIPIANDDHSSKPVQSSPLQSPFGHSHAHIHNERFTSVPNTQLFSNYANFFNF